MSHRGGVVQSPSHPGQFVPLEFRVSGKHVGPVQVLVKARDDAWYLQAPSRGHGHALRRWTVDAFFGVGDSPAGTPYEFVVVAGRNTVKVPVLADLIGLPVIFQGIVTRF